MKITNKNLLPQPLVNACHFFAKQYKDSSQFHADISVTQLINPPQLVELKRRHDEELEEDVVDQAWALMGNALHLLLENAASPTDEVEVRFYTEFDDWTISGMVDIYDTQTNVLWDYKNMSVWEVMRGVKFEREAQLNVLRFLAEENGRRVNNLALCCVFRDWQKAKRFNRDYPPTPIMQVQVPMWSMDKTVSFIRDRVSKHKAHRTGMAYIKCNSYDMWEKPTQYAVMRKGRKTAFRVLDEEIKAEKMAHTKGKDYYVEKRPGSKPRCEEYCPVRHICPQNNGTLLEEAACE